MFHVAFCMKRNTVILAVGLFLFGFTRFASAQGNQNFDRINVHVEPIQGNVYLLTGAGGNVTVQAGPDGVLVVDTQFAPMAPKILTAIWEISHSPIRYIINTHSHRDHSGGNEPLAKAGQPPAGQNSCPKEGACIVAHENVLKTLSAPPSGKPGDRSAPRGNWPALTYRDRMTIKFNGEEIELIHEPDAHSSGDTIVFFHGSNVVSAGDIYAASRYPSYDDDGSIDGMISGLNRILTMVAPPDKFGQGGTVIVPGHGRLVRQPELVAYRDMSVMLRQRMQGLVAKGMTLEQVKAAQPMKEYEPVYGGNTGVSSTEYVIEQIYNNLKQKKSSR